MGEEELLNLLASSKMRREILEFLGDGPKTLSQIKDHAGTGPSQLSRNLKELMDHNLVAGERKTFALTSQGEIVLENYRPFADTVDLFERQADYWKDHDLTCIPRALQYRIGELHNSEHIRDDTEDLNRILTTLLNLMAEAKQMYIASPIFDAIIVGTLLNAVRNGVQIEILLTGPVFEKTVSENPELSREFWSHENYHDYVVAEPIKTPFVLTDRYFYFTTYYTNGIYDTQGSMVSTDPQALRWGRDLFRHHKARAVKADRSALERLQVQPQAGKK